jgi:CelD/BcsL family acetyltransferase involved in cellulose biosynthesis
MADAQFADVSPQPRSLTHGSQVSGFDRSAAGVADFGVQVEVVGRLDRLRELEADYSELERATQNTLPFALHAWHVAWWNHLAATGPAIRDALMIHVVRDEAGKPIAIVPLVLTQRTHLGIRVASLAPLGADPWITELRPPLVAPGMEVRALGAIQRLLAADDRWDWIQWTGLDERMAAALERSCMRLSCSLRWREPTVDCVLDLEPTWEAFRAKLKRNIRESLRHCYNSLKRDRIHFEFEVACTRTDVERALGHFLALHSMRAESNESIPHPNRFVSARSQQFLYDVCDRLAASGVARVFLLRVQGEVVAARVGFVVGTSLYLYYSGFDRRWARYSVMTTTVAEAIKYAISLGLRTVNLSAGLDVSKTRWGVRHVPFGEAIQCRTHMRSRLACAGYEARLLLNSHPLLMPMRRALPMRSWT